MNIVLTRETIDKYLDKKHLKQIVDAVCSVPTTKDIEIVQTMFKRLLNDSKVSVSDGQQQAMFMGVKKILGPTVDIHEFLDNIPEWKEFRLDVKNNKVGKPVETPFKPKLVSSNLKPKENLLVIDLTKEKDELIRKIKALFETWKESEDEELEDQIRDLNDQLTIVKLVLRNYRK